MVRVIVQHHKMHQSAAPQPLSGPLSITIHSIPGQLQLSDMVGRHRNDCPARNLVLVSKDWSQKLL